MTRFTSAINQTEATQISVTMCLMVDAYFASGTLSLHDGIGTITDTFSSPNVTYLGVGAFGSVDGNVQDSLSVIARPIKLSLTGVDSAVISEAMTTVYQGRDIALSLGFSRNGALIAAPQVVWEGRMDNLEVEFGLGTASVTLSCEHRLRREPRIARYTDEDQRILYPNDRFFRYLNYIQGFKSQWGDRPTAFVGGLGTIYAGGNGNNWKRAFWDLP